MLIYAINNRILPSLMKIEQNRTRLDDLKLPQHLIAKKSEQAARRAAKELILLNGLEKEMNSPVSGTQNLSSAEYREQDRLEHRIYNAILEGQNRSKRGKPLDRDILFNLIAILLPKRKEEIFNLQRGYVSNDVHRRMLRTLEELEVYLRDTEDHPVVRAAIVTHTIHAASHEWVEDNLLAQISGLYVLSSLGYGFERLNYVTEFFAENPEEFRATLDNPKNWVEYFIHKVEEQSEAVLEEILGSRTDVFTERIAQISRSEYKMLLFLVEREIRVFRPIDLTKKLKVSNRTIATWAGNLVRQGFLDANTRGERIISYAITDYTIRNAYRIRYAYESYSS